LLGLLGSRGHAGNSCHSHHLKIIIFVLVKFHQPLFLSLSGHFRIFHRAVHASNLRCGVPLSNVGRSIRNLHISVFDALDTALCSLLYLYYTWNFAGGNLKSLNLNLFIHFYLC
jgi:hypothetical protein